jgi:hypothetical protein
LALTATVCRDDDLLVQELDDEIVMANVESGQYFGFGDVGRQIWLLLDQPRAVADICTSLRDVYVVDAATCERDVVVFLSELLEKGIIRRLER